MCHGIAIWQEIKTVADEYKAGLRFHWRHSSCLKIAEKQTSTSGVEKHENLREQWIDLN